MKRIFVAVAMCSLLSVGIPGCAKKSSTESETTVTTPGGTTTVTTERDVKQTGDNPPPVRP